MRSVSLRLSDLERNPMVPIGFEGENEYTTVNIDCKKIFDEHPTAVPTWAVTPPQGDSYPVVVVRDGDIVSWTVCDSDLVYPGSGKFQLSFVIGDEVIGKTYSARTRILDSITPSGNAPTAIQNWLTQAAAALQALPQDVATAVATLMGAMVGVGETLDPGENVTVSYDTENNTLTIGVPRGADGQDGQDGVDGHTPVITAEKVGKVTTLYVDGTAIATVEDGESGTELIDDNAGAGDTDKVWSADKSASEISDVKSEINARTNVENLYEQLYEDLGYIDTSTGALYLYNATYIEKASKFIPVTAGEMLHYQAWASGDPHGRIGYYDSSKAFVSYEDIPSANRETVTGGYYAHLDKTVPTGISYIRFSYYSFGDGKACIVRSATKTGWIPAQVDEGSKVYNSADDYDLKGINHRGYNTVAPENTIPAFILSAQHGFKFVETDLNFTSDNVPVCLHDITINRTARNADGTELSSDVAINSITFSQSQDYDFGIWKGSAYAGTKLPKFEDFIILCKQLGLHPYIELKNDIQYTEAQILSAIAIVNKYDMAQNCTWISFALNPLYVVKRNSPYSRIGYIVSTITGKRITEAQFLRTQYNETFLDANITNLTSELIATTKAGGVALEVFSIDTEAGMLALDSYISGVTSNVYDFQKVVQKDIMPDEVSGSTPTITGIEGHRYICGECSTLSVVAPASGCIDVLFKSGSTATTLTVTSAKSGTTIAWANGFDPSDLEANTTYELNILDGELGVACSWT